METSKAPLGVLGSFLSKTEGAKKNDGEPKTPTDSESRQLLAIRGDLRLKMQGEIPSLPLQEIQLAKACLLEGSAFRQLCDNLRIWVFPVMSEYIKSVVGTSLNPPDRIYMVECKVRWELLHYQRKELSREHAISEVLTITGSPVCASATSAAIT